MSRFLLASICCAGLATAACSTPAPTAAGQPRIVDLGHALAETDPSWTGEKVFTRSTAAAFDKDGYAAGRVSTEEHFGTHVDAPAHFAVDGLTVDRIPADRLIHDAVVINVAAQAAKDEDYRLSRSDIDDFERAHGAIAEGAIVLVATGWDARWPDAARYMNVRDGAKHFPGLSVEAATYLARDRKVGAIGIDTPSIDYGPSADFAAHKTTMPLGVFHIENMSGLTALPATGITVIVAPMKIAGGSGGPTRAFALLPR